MACWPRPARSAPNSDAAARVDLVERLLHRRAGRAPPYSQAASAPVRPSAKRDVRREVVALAVVGLDPLDAELEHARAPARCHHAPAAGEVKSTGEPVPIHQRPT